MFSPTPLFEAQISEPRLHLSLETAPSLVDWHAHTRQGRSHWSRMLDQGRSQEKIVLNQRVIQRGTPVWEKPTGRLAPVAVRRHRADREPVGTPTALLHSGNQVAAPLTRT